MRSLCANAIFVSLLCAFTGWGCNSNRQASTSTDGQQQATESAEDMVTPVVELAGSPDSPSAKFVKQALESHGGDDLIRKLNHGRIKMTVSGEMFQGFQGTTTVTDSFDGSTRFRRDVESIFGKEPGKLTFVINGDSASSHVRAGSLEYTSSAKGNSQENILLATFKTLTSIARGELLTSGPEDSAEGETKIIDIRRNGGIIGEVHFDSKSLLIAGSLKHIPDPKTGNPIELATIYDKYQEFDGVVIPMRVIIMRGEDIFADVNVEQIEFLDSLDEDLFALPPQP